MESKLLKVFQVHKAVFLKFVFLSLPFCYISDSLIQIIKEKRNKEKERVGKERVGKGRNVEQFLTFGASGIGGFPSLTYCCHDHEQKSMQTLNCDEKNLS